MEYSAPSLDTFLTAEGMSGIPIGIDFEGTDFEKDRFSYQAPLCELSHRIKANSECENAVTLYKSLLSNSEDKVDIIEIGFPQILSGILESEGGIDLFMDKVGHIYVMAGKWDEETGREHNFYNNHRSRRAGNILCEKCPVQITFLGFESGFGILSGDGLSKDDALSLCLRSHGCEKTGRHLWDPLTVRLAIIGDAEKAGYKTVSGRAYVDAGSGCNRFKIGDGIHRYVVKNEPDEYYRNELQKLIKKL